MFDTNQFKKAVLNKAIRGELTTRLPEDGSAEVLLKEVDDEKKRLIEEGEIKKQKPLPDIEENDILFKIPKKWKWVRMGYVGAWKSGSTPKRDHPEYYNGNIPWLKTGDLNDNVIKETSETISELGLKKANLRLNPIGSVLIAMYGATIGKLGILNIEATTNQACCACQLYAGISNKYLFYFLMSQKNALVSLGAGGAQPNISRTKLINYPFPLPPLSEQKRIVASIEKCFDFAEYIEKENDLTKDFQVEMKKSLLQAAMKGDLTKQSHSDGSADDLLKEIDDEKNRLIEEGKIKKQKALPDIEDDEIPFEIPSNWKWVRLGNINNIVMGQSPKGKDVFEGSPNSENYEFHQGKTFFSDKVISPSNKVTKSDARLINSNYIIMSVRAPVGDVNQLDRTIYIGRGLCGICPYKYRKDFLYYYLSSQKNNLMRKSTGSTFKAINKTTVFNHLIPLPPLNEQKRIVEKLDELFSKLDN